MLGALRLFGLILLGTALAFWAEASIVHSPKFKIDGLVIVWQGEDGAIASTPPKANAGRTATLSTTFSTPSPPLSPGPVVTGTLLPVSHASEDTETHALHAPAQGDTSFYVASNTAFNIDAELSGATTLSAETLETLSFDMAASLDGGALPGTGRKAQYPHSGGSRGGINPNIKTLEDLRQRTTVFTGNQRTAVKPGTIAEQSVKFTVKYGSLDVPPPANMPSVTFTVFVP